MRRERWALFLSGRGSTAQAALDMQGEVDIALVVSNNPHALGVTRAHKAGVPVFLLSKKIDWPELTKKLNEMRIDCIFLLGFMRLLPESFVQKHAGRIFNIHPSLLPDYPGLHSIEKSFEAGSAMGVTIHEVVPEMDAGPILLQSRVLESAPSSSHSLTIADAQFLISRTEQRLIREFLSRGQAWRQAHRKSLSFQHLAAATGSPAS